MVKMIHENKINFVYFQLNQMFKLPPEMSDINVGYEFQKNMTEDTWIETTITPEMVTNTRNNETAPENEVK